MSVEGGVEDTLVNFIILFLEVSAQTVSGCSWRLFIRLGVQYFFVLAGHMVEEMIVYFFIKFLIFVDLVFTQVDRVISHIFHDKLGVFIEMLFVGGCGAGFISFGHD